MKTVGIIGGIGPESTIAYYREILASYRERTQAEAAPSLLINSVDLSRLRTMFEQERHAEAVDYLAREIEKLQAGGANFAVLAAVTAHIVFDALCERVHLPLISIVEATRKAAVGYRLQKAALFGTRFTMNAPFFPELFSKVHIRIVPPSRSEQEYIHEKYFGELVKGVFLEQTRGRMLEIVSRLRRDEGIDGLILGGTELPLLLNNESHNGVRFLNTTQLHVAAVVNELLS